MIELRSYGVDNSLEAQNDDELLKSFTQYGGDTYICDAISYMADDSVSIWNKTLCNQAWGLYISGAYEEASAQGLMSGSHDFIRHLQIAWSEYSTEQIYSNYDELMFNYAAEYLNNRGVEINDDEEEILFEALKNYDHNNTLDDLIATACETLNIEVESEAEL